MNKTTRFGLFSMMLLGMAQFAPGQDESAENSAVAITLPSEMRKLSFQLPGIVGEVAVKEGDAIKKDQPLMVQDLRMELAELEKLKLEASPLAVEFAEADLAFKEVELKRVTTLYNAEGGRIVSDTEKEAAELEVTKARLSVARAKEEVEIAKLEIKVREVQVDLRHLRSPIDGEVQSLDLGAGEVVDPQKPVCVVVKNDPLWVEIYLPTDQAALVQKGQKLQIRYEKGEDTSWKEGNVIFIAPVADAASLTRLIRLQMPNPTNKASGEQVLVKLPEKTARAGVEAAQAK